ncbi:hypothetical protein NE237_024773 [Protea cynaroides]|uniref:Gamma-glutamylcyclotransferase n=1 Tax=Protea cynaroides TaxID=273540 RepID=A0A9Q0JZX9_9MAGN|nr:hypothetical protein NE237_024773 [Protea cynaroides]
MASNGEKHKMNSAIKQIIDGQIKEEIIEEKVFYIVENINVAGFAETIATAIVFVLCSIYLSLIYPIMVLWVFGYGSLVWNPGFEFDESVIGFIKDYRRVFDLACIDHMGTPENPARTLTLEASEGDICWGAAYCVKGGPERERVAMEYLERRESEYDQKALVNFYTEGETVKPFLTRVLVFKSTPDKESNKYYLGPAPLEKMARQIATAVGPCGNNRNYLFNLEKALFDIGHEDDYVIELANEVRKVLGLIVRPKENLVVPHMPLNSDIAPLQFVPLPEPIVMDS